MKQLIAVAMAAAIVALPALAKPPPGTDIDSPLHTWFENQQNVAGISCCGKGDGHFLADTDWRANNTGTGYDVRVEGAWYPVPPNRMRDPVVGGPNITNRAIVWYQDNPAGPIIWCFAPGFQA